MLPVTMHCIIPAVVLFLYMAQSRAWWIGENRQVGLLSERVREPGAANKEYRTLDHSGRVEGWWPTAGRATYAAALLGALVLAVGLILRRFVVWLPVLGYLGAAASVVVLVAGMAFVLGKPQILAGTRWNMGIVTMLIGAPFGVIGGILLVKGV